MNCGRCRALNRRGNCELGYAIERIYYHKTVIDATPLEECPRPISKDQYVEALKSKKKAVQ